MDSLIAELEHATEGSRELDGNIWWLTNRASAERAYWNAASGLPKPLPNKIPSGLGWLAIKNAAPHYTTSLDAALTLVPEGCGWHVNEAGEAVIFRLERDQDSEGGLVLGNCLEAPAPALGMCLAIARARQAMKDVA